MNTISTAFVLGVILLLFVLITSDKKDTNDDGKENFRRWGWRRPWALRNWRSRWW
jgi:hypothetical protein